MSFAVRWIAGARSETRRQPIKRGSAGEERPEPQAVAHGRRRQATLELALSPMSHHAGQRNADRAHLFAAAAEGRGVGQLPALGDADERGRQHRAHWSRIDPAVSMAADRLIDRAMVHAGAAADAA